MQPDSTAALRHAFREVLSTVQPHNVECLSDPLYRDTAAAPMLTAPTASSLGHAVQPSMPQAANVSRMRVQVWWIGVALVIGALLAILVLKFCQRSRGGEDVPRPLARRKQNAQSDYDDEDDPELVQAIAGRFDEDFDDSEPRRQPRQRESARQLPMRARGAQQLAPDPRDVFPADSDESDNVGRIPSKVGRIPTIAQQESVASDAEYSDPNFQPLQG